MWDLVIYLICVTLRGKQGRGCRGWERAEGEEVGMIIEYLELIFMIVVFWLCGELRL